MPKLLLLFVLTVLCNMAFSQRFVENKGQWDEKVLFKTSLPNGTLFAEKTCLTFSFYHPDDVKRSHAHHHFTGEEDDHAEGKIRTHTYKIQFLDAGNATITKENPLPEYENFFIGNDPSKWTSNVKSFESVLYTDLYPGIDLKLHSSADFYFKYDFIVHPGAEAEKIKLKYEGHDKIEATSDGGIKITTTLNDIKEIKPVAWQEINGKKILIECRFLVKDPYVAYTFPAGYNPDYTLYIDPILIFSTYSGSTTDNWGFTATFDENSHVFSGGIVLASGYPANTGSYQISNAGQWDVAIIKYNDVGNTRIFATYIGGMYCEMPHSMVADREGNLLLFGTTGSSNFPITTGAYDTQFGGGTNLVYDNVIQYPNGCDIYVSKISADGTQLMASTFIGGTQNDGMNFRSYYTNFMMHGNDSLYYNYADGARGEIICGKMNEVYVGTTTFSADFPVTPGAFQAVYAGRQEGVVFKLSPSLDNLMWSSYFGGTMDDAIFSLDIDMGDEIYIAGGTSSSNIPTTGGVYQPLSQGGSTDGFVAHISSNGGTIIKSTYFGSPAYDQAYFVRVDKFRNIYITGQTKASGSTFIMNAAYGTPNSGQFITKFPNDLSYPVWSTVFGTGIGRPNISITAFAVDFCNRIYLSGWGREWADSDGYTWASIQGTKNMYVTNPGAQQTVTDGQDFYLMVMADDASQIEYATFFGEQHALDPSGYYYCGHDHVDGGTSRFDKRGNIYQSICASCGIGCNTFPTFPNPGAWSNVNGGIYSPNTWVCNNAVFKFNFEMPLTLADFTYTNVCLGEPTEFTNTSMYSTSYTWYFGDGTTSTDQNPTHTYTTPGNYVVSLAAENPTSCNLADSTWKLVVVEDLSLQSEDTAVCQNAMVQLLASYGGSATPSIVWSSNPNFTDTLNASPNIPYINVTATQSETYYIHAQSTFCELIDSVRVTVYPVGVTVSPDTMICAGTTTQIVANSLVPGDVLTYVWSNGGFIVSGQGTSTVTVNPTYNTTFTVTVTNQHQCTSVSTTQIDIDNFQILSGASTNITCFSYCNGTASVFAQGIGTMEYHWNNLDTAQNINGLCPNNYTVTVTDDVGCSGTYTAQITQPPLLVANPQILQLATCSSTNPNTGIAVVTPVGGTPGYSFHWSNQFTDSLQNNLYAGNYTITVSDVNGCDTIVSISITDESPMVISIQPQMPTCYGYCDGTAQSQIVVHGTQPYQYDWSNNATTPGISNLCAGTYMLTITDNDFCSRFQAVEVLQPNPITSDIQTPGIACWGGSTSLTAHVIGGGTSPYTYVWNTGATTTTINNAVPGTYWVISTDSHGCKDTVDITITQPTPLLLDSATTDVTCLGVCDGQVLVDPDGGTPPYSFTWNGASGGYTINHLCEGIYDVTVTDFRGCTSILTMPVGNGGYVPPVDATADQYQVYEGQSTTLHALTNTSINTYHWSPPGTISGIAMQHPTATPEGTTTYTVSIVDAMGCVNVDTVTITVLDVICGEPYIYVPNAFTPNDDGVNDMLYIYAPMAQEIFFAVYDRWGEMVFFSKDTQHGWDGTYKGKALDPAVFVFYLKVTCVDKMSFEKQGNITLVR